MLKGKEGSPYLPYLPKEITASPETPLQMLKQILEESPIGQAIEDENGTFVYVNPKLVHLLGYNSPEDIAGKHWRKFVVKEEREKVRAETAKRSEGIASAYSTKLSRADGRIVHCEIVATPIIIEDRTLFVHVAFTDITLQVLLTKTMEALNRAISLDDLLGTIGENIWQLIPFDSAILHLVDVEGNVHIHRRWGDSGELETVTDLGGFSRIDHAAALSKIVATKNPLIIPNTTKQEAPWLTKKTEKKPTLSYIGVPLVVEEEVIGVLSLNSKTVNMFSEEDLANLTPFAAPIAAALERARLFAKMEELARTDPLTGLRLPRGLEPQVKLQIERTNRSGRPFSLVFLDLDYLKNYNDAFGHPEGNIRLQQIAKILKKIRGVDSAFRVGGDEFVLLLEDCNESTALKIAFRLQENMHLLPKEINNKPVPIMSQTGLPASSSFTIGITTVHKDDPRTIDDLIKTADKSMYFAKEGGRNCAGIYLPKMTVEPKAGIRVEGFEQFVVIKPRATNYLSRRTQVKDLYLDIVPSYWEIEVLRPKLTTVSKKDEVSYESFVKYSVFATEPNRQETRNIYIYRKTKEEVDNYPVATLSFGPGVWQFDGGLDYHKTLEGGQQPKDSFTWVNILFPQKEAFPEKELKQEEQFLL